MVATVANRYGILHCARAQSLSTIYVATTLIAHSTSSLANESRVCIIVRVIVIVLCFVAVAAYNSLERAKVPRSGRGGTRRLLLCSDLTGHSFFSLNAQLPIALLFPRCFIRSSGRSQLRNYRTFNLAWYQRLIRRRRVHATRTMPSSLGCFLFLVVNHSFSLLPPRLLSTLLSRVPNLRSPVSFHAQRIYPRRICRDFVLVVVRTLLKTVDFTTIVSLRATRDPPEERTMGVYPIPSTTLRCNTIYFDVLHGYKRFCCIRYTASTN